MSRLPLSTARLDEDLVVDPQVVTPTSINLLEHIHSRPIKLASIPVTADNPPNMKQRETLQHLLDCLCYALAIDDTINLATVLGVKEPVNNHEALGIWIGQTTEGIPSMDASTLFNYLVRQLDSLLLATGRQS